jgi:hypothetical protein
MRESVSSTVQPISFEVLYSCPATERFSLSHNEELYTTTSQLNRQFQDDSRVNETVEGEDIRENYVQPDDNYDDEEMGSVLGIALPNLATASFSEISRLDSVPGNDTIQLNVGADRVLPSRVGSSTIANLFLSLPTTCPNGTHRGVSGTVSSVPTESGHQVFQENKVNKFFFKNKTFSCRQLKQQLDGQLLVILFYLERTQRYCFNVFHATQLTQILLVSMCF